MAKPANPFSHCSHCGSPCPPPTEPDSPVFCCKGCEAAYNLIHAMGLKSYYCNRTLAETERALIPELQDFVGLEQYIQPADDGTETLYLMLEGIHCGACVALVEATLAKQTGVVKGRVNMTTKRLVLTWKPSQTDAKTLLNRITALGYRVLPYNPALLKSTAQKEEKALLFSLAIAGFAAANVMLFSAGMWAGGENLAPATLAFFQYISALIVLPAAVFAARPFFASALTALRHGRMNMDVPISLAVFITLALSTHDMVFAKGETYFESAAMLLFFLLIGRYLDMRMRGKSQQAAEHLSGLQATVATRVKADGTLEVVPLAHLQVGDTLLVARGERIAADGTLQEDTATLDTSVLTGESLPQSIQRGDMVFAGCLNVENPIHITLTHVGEATNLAHIIHLVENASLSKGAYKRLADRVAQVYAPAVHLLAAVTFAFWWGFQGENWHTALVYATAVLIVTCPCALALAVPAVQVVVVSRLLRLGVLVKDGLALERLKDTKTMVFDKTGTLTTGAFSVTHGGTQEERLLAATLAQHSTHPLAKAVAGLVPITETRPMLTHLQEHAGQGMQATFQKETLCLGNASFCGASQGEVQAAEAHLKAGETLLWFRVGEQPPLPFHCRDTMRKDAPETVRLFQQAGCRTLLLSGDTPATVEHVAQQVGITDALGGQTPQEKHAFLESLQAKEPVLMCGDGINDAPSLACAHAALTFATGSQIAQAKADIILQNNRLKDAYTAWQLAKAANRTAYTNIAFSFSYNTITVPLAMAGYITPLWAALFMSASSLTVVLNALRLAKAKV